jgi:hypothetical protein
MIVAALRTMIDEVLPARGRLCDPVLNLALKRPFGTPQCFYLSIPFWT